MPKCGRGEKGIDVRADSEERDIAKVEKPGEADDDVQAEGEEGVEANPRDDAHDVIVGREQRSGEREDRKPDRGERLVAHDPHTFSRSARPSPSSPSGRKTRVMIRTRERDDVLEGRIDEGDGEALDNAEEQPAEHRAPDVADAAEHRRGECLEPGRVAHDEVDLRIIEADQYAGRAAERRAEEEGGADNLADTRRP